jgi:GNAT superfamily N-acetyltransferase
MQEILRSASLDDAPAMAALFEQLGYPTPVAEIRRRLEGRGSGSDVFVAVDGCDVVGFVAVSVEANFVGKRSCAIGGLVVRDTHRNREIGALLLGAAERWSLERGVALVTVRSNVVRERARRFYERHGYEIAKTQRIFEKRLGRGD